MLLEGQGWQIWWTILWKRVQRSCDAAAGCAMRRRFSCSKCFPGQSTAAAYQLSLQPLVGKTCGVRFLFWRNFPHFFVGSPPLSGNECAMQVCELLQSKVESKCDQGSWILTCSLTLEELWRKVTKSLIGVEIWMQFYRIYFWIGAWSWMRFYSLQKQCMLASSLEDTFASCRLLRPWGSFIFGLHSILTF